MLMGKGKRIAGDILGTKLVAISFGIGHHSAFKLARILVAPASSFNAHLAG
jgi:hypothetical protein